MKPLYEYIVKSLKPTRGIVGDYTQITDGDFLAVIKHFDEPSKEYGIDGGKISKLWIKNTKTNKVVLNYDRGWDVKLDKSDAKLKKFYERILKDINESTGTFIQFDLEDLQQWDVWQPNDDITKEDCLAIGKAFYDNWPADHNDCGTINGLSVKCEHIRGTDTIKFTIYIHDEDEKAVISVVEEIVNMLTNTVYSVGPGKGAKRLIKSMLFKL